ncbi:MAG: hypothetical protein KDD56_08055, partial [Bdellovibrionales bacterium]|nr:hypothetical protein [Bdellovibrionales bacterium]
MKQEVQSHDEAQTKKVESKYFNPKGVFRIVFQLSAKLLNQSKNTHPLKMRFKGVKRTSSGSLQAWIPVKIIAKFFNLEEGNKLLNDLICYMQESNLLLVSFDRHKQPVKVALNSVSRIKSEVVFDRRAKKFLNPVQCLRLLSEIARIHKKNTPRTFFKISVNPQLRDSYYTKTIPEKNLVAFFVHTNMPLVYKTLALIHSRKY